MKKFFSFLSGNRLFFIITMFVGILYSANSVLLPTLAGNLINAVTGNLSGTAGVILLYLGAYLLQLLLSQSDTYLSGKFKIRQRAVMRRNIYDSYVSDFGRPHFRTSGSYDKESISDRRESAAEDFDPDHRESAAENFVPDRRESAAENFDPDRGKPVTENFVPDREERIIADPFNNREKLAAAVSFLNNDLPAVVEQYFAGTIDIIKCVCLILFSTISLFSIHWLLAAEILGFSVLIVCAPALFKQKGNQARSRVSEAMAQYNLQIQSFLAGFPVLKAYGYRKRSSEFVERFNARISHEESGQLRCRVAVYGTTAFLQISKDAVILISSVLLIGKGAMSVGNLVTVLQLASLLAAPVEVLASLRHSRNEVGSLLKKYEETLEENGQKKLSRPSLDKTEHNLGAGNSIRRKDAVDISGKTEEKDLSERTEDENLREIRLQNVSCTAESIPILRPVNYTFYAGKKYLITGESGSGKSTLLRCIARMAETMTEGKVLFNEKEDDKIPDAVYYKHICPVFQEPYLFYATMEENILLGRDIPDPLYRDVINRLHLEYLLERYAGREITPEHVEQLSGGEKQRIALARAMVGRPEAYLLDEVTSALDQKNAEDVERMFLEEDAMVIFVSHKPDEELRERYTEHLLMEHGSLLSVYQRGKI